MRRSPILADFLKIAQTPALPAGTLEPGGKRQITVADIDLCRAQLNRRHDEDGTKDRCDVIVRAANLGESATIKGLAKDTQRDVKYIKKWLARFNADGYEGLIDAPRHGSKPIHDENEILIRINTLLSVAPNMLESKDRDLNKKLKGNKSWKVPLLASVLGLPYTTLLRIIHKHKIDVAPKHSWCLSKDPNYEVKLRKCNDLYQLAHNFQSDNDVVLCFDEKPCIQAIEREIIRLSKGRIRFGSRYVRNGVIHLFAVLNVKTGHAYYQFRESKTREDVKDFLDWVLSHDELKDKQIHMILDNLCTHKNLGDEWWAKHPNLEFAFTPTCASWVNLVESFFGIFTRCCLKNASWESVEELVTVCGYWFEAYNAEAKPFNWRMKDIDRHLDQRSHALNSLQKVLGQEDLDRLINDSCVAKHMELKLVSNQHLAKAA